MMWYRLDIMRAQSGTVEFGGVKSKVNESVMPTEEAEEGNRGLD